MSGVKAEIGQGKKVDLDTILEEEVGQFGRYQLVNLALILVPVIVFAFVNREYIFTTARIPTRCVIPQCDGENPEFAPPWVLNAIPGASADSFEECVRYAARNASVPSPAPAADSCPAELFDRSQTVPCEDYVYENTDTVFYDFNLACDEWRRSQIGSIRCISMLVGLPISGYISDRWGRRLTLILIVLNTGWLGLARSFVNSYEWFVTLEVMETFFSCGINSCCFILVIELVGPKYRVIASAATLSMYAVGQILMGLIAWAVQKWRTLTQVLYAPQLLIVCYFWFLSESVRWLLSKDRYKEAENILKKMAKANNKELSEKSLKQLRASSAANKNVEKVEEPWLIPIVFRSKRVLLRCLVSPIWWFTNNLVLFGMSINAVNLSGNKYLNFVYVGAIEIPGYWTAMVLLDRVGRKPVLICGYLLCAVSQFTFAFLPEGMDYLSLAAYLLAKYSVATSVKTAFLYSTELFPTKYRHRLLAFPTTVGRFGSIIAPLTPALALKVWAPFPPVLFGSLSLASALLAFTMPETLGTKLPDTMEEAERIGNKERTPDFEHTKL